MSVCVGVCLHGYKCIYVIPCVCLCCVCIVYWCNVCKCAVVLCLVKLCCVRLSSAVFCCGVLVCAYVFVNVSGCAFVVCVWLRVRRFRGFARGCDWAVCACAYVLRCVCELNACMCVGLYLRVFACLVLCLLVAWLVGLLAWSALCVTD